MKNSTSQFLRYLREKNLHYTIEKDSGYNSDEVDIIFIRNNGENMQNMNIGAFVDDTTISVYLRIAQVSYDKKSYLLSELNKINSDYRYVRFYVNDDNAVQAQVDFDFMQDSAATICFSACVKIVYAVDNCYGRIMKCIW